MIFLTLNADKPSDKKVKSKLPLLLKAIFFHSFGDRDCPNYGTQAGVTFRTILELGLRLPYPTLYFLFLLFAPLFNTSLPLK